MPRTIAAPYAFLVHQAPKLSRERELELALRWRDHADTAARDELVRSQLRYVVAIARRYRRGAGAALDELIAEGNFGLVQALRKFDPDRGTRFVTYAAYWIRAYISQYLIRSRSLVTAGVHSKLLSKVRRERAKTAGSTGEESNADGQLALQLAVTPEKLRSLVERLDLRDVPWDTFSEDALGAHFLEPQQGALNAEQAALCTEAEEHLSIVVSGALSKLDDRERHIVQQRLMAHPDEQSSLADVGRHFRISRERARQLEARAIGKLKIALKHSPAAVEWIAQRVAA